MLPFYNSNFSGYFISYFLFYLLCLILTVAYFTLFERKVIGSIQRRLGPNYAGVFGILQPLADALKLIFKEFSFPRLSLYTHVFPPIFVFFFSLLLWAFIPFYKSNAIYFSSYSLLWILAIASLNTYSIFLAGWFSSSKYAFLGAIRSILQFISYEIAFSFLLMPIIFVSGSFNLTAIVNSQINASSPNFFWLIPNFLLIFICLLAETNRAPFDLPEAEAELVAGYNVEYSSIPFAYFFLGEYLNILMSSFLISLLFLSGDANCSFILGYIMFCLKFFLISFLIVWIRATLPRARYDHLLTFCWKYALLIASSLLMFYLTLYFLAVITI